MRWTPWLTLLLSVSAFAGEPLPSVIAAGDGGESASELDAGSALEVQPGAARDAPIDAPIDAPVDAPVDASASVTPGESDGGTRVLVAILPFEANEEGAAQAAGVTSLVASHLSEDRGLNVIAQSDVSTLLSFEKQRTQLGIGADCQEDCLSQVSEVLGARYVITGRLDRFGKRYVVTAGLFDAEASRSLARPTAEASRADTLPAAVRKVSLALMTPLGASLKSGEGSPLLELETDPDAGQWAVGLRVSNSFIHQLAALNPGADLDLLYRVHHGWHGFLQIGFKLRRAQGDQGEGGFSVLPSVVGVRHVLRLEESFQPYWGAGFGLQLSFGQFGVFQNTGPLPTVSGLFGARYVIRESFAVSLEGGTNVAQMLLGIAGSGLGSGLNIDVTGGVSYLF